MGSKLNSLSLQELCLQRNLHKRAFRYQLLGIIKLGRSQSSRMSVEATFQLMQRWSEQLEKDMKTSPKTWKRRNSSHHFTIQIMWSPASIQNFRREGRDNHPMAKPWPGKGLLTQSFKKKKKNGPFVELVSAKRLSKAVLRLQVHQMDRFF